MNASMWPTKAITNDFIFEGEEPPRVWPNPLRARLCRGENEYPLSFCLRLSENMNNVTIRVASNSYSGIRPRVKVRYVKRWWRGGLSLKHEEDGVYVPELLLNNPILVMASPTHKKKNVVLMPIDDTDHIMPTWVPSDETQQYWVSISVPADCKTGTTRFTLSAFSGDKLLASMPLTVEVLPFDLPPMPPTYAYYRGRLEGWPPTISSEQRTSDQYYEEMKCMARYGITPTFFQKPDSLYFEGAIAIRRSAGISVDPLLWTTLSCGYPGDAAGDTCERSLQLIRAKALTERLGIQELFAYGKDEAIAADLEKQKTMWNIARQQGIKIHAAASNRGQEFLEIMGNKADFVLLYGDLRQGKTDFDWLIPEFHKFGVKCFFYDKTSPLSPATTRMRNGLQTESLGFDGVFPYAIAHAFPDGKSDIWDNFTGFNPGDHQHHVWLRPTLSGKPVECTSIAAFTAGRNDVRYWRLLKEWNPNAVMPSPTSDLDVARDSMVDQLLDLYVQGGA